MDNRERLLRLAAHARLDRKGMNQFLMSDCADWIPAKGDPGTPNREYTRTRQPRWRALSVLIHRVRAGHDVSPATIETVAEMFTSEDITWPTVTQTAAGLAVNKGCVPRLVRAGKLRDNGKRGTPRRIDPASILEYCEREGIAYNDT